MTEPGVTIAALTAGSVDESLRFERLLSHVAASFIDLPIGRIDEAIDDGLQRIVATLGVDRSTLSMVDRGTGQFHSSHSWAARGFTPVPKAVSSRTYPWALARFRAGLPVVFARLGELPPEAAVDAASYASIGLRAHVGVPVMVSGEFVAVLGFAALQHERTWPDELVARMRLLADVFGSALARKRTQDRIDELLRFERLLVEVSTALVGSLGSALDDELVHALRAVARFLGADRIGLCALAAGTTRLDVTHQWIAEGPSAVSPGLDAVASSTWIVDRVVAGELVTLPVGVRPAPESGGDATVLRAEGIASLLVVPLRVKAVVVGALVLSSGQDERLWPDEFVPRLGLFGNMLVGALAYRSAERTARQATVEAAQAREHLAHLGRVDAVDAMSAAIAHEINQPLVAIENYAMAGRRRLAGSEAIDRARLDALLDKIDGQAALASDVLDRLRGLVKRRETREAKCALERTIRDALQLVEIEGRLKDIRIEAAVPPGLPSILGDEIQIQQVILNLAHNAMEAMAEVPAHRRVLRVEAAVAGDDGVVVRVADRGPGIVAAEEAKIFEPFFTTKATGLGIGLSICRSIVEAHGGKLWHAPNPGGGAVFQFTLPSASDGA
jgi:signal transduction histidine kinase